MKKRALMSVFVKDGILELAQYLKSADWEILSTGGTAKYLTDNGIQVTDVSSVTNFPECLDGRVKTLHPAIHAGLLARRDNPEHMKTIQDLDIKKIAIALGIILFIVFPETTASVTGFTPYIKLI